jgi:hypothetical protein
MNTPLLGVCPECGAGDYDHRPDCPSVTDDDLMERLRTNLQPGCIQNSPIIRKILDEMERRDLIRRP